LSELKPPYIIINFKVYKEVEGIGSLCMASACAEVAEESGMTIIPCPPMVELARVCDAFHIPVMAQHVDAKSPGSVTGWVTPESVLAAGAAGTLLNHSEHSLSPPDIGRSVASCKKIDLLTCVCADSAETAGAVATSGPSMVAVEPPELIGGDISVTNAKPEIVSLAVEAVRKVDANIPVLCGAGVKTGQDVKRALELGAKGVLLASGVVKAKDPKASLRDLVRLI